MKKKKLLKTILIVVAIPAVLIGSLTVYAVAKGTTAIEFAIAIKLLGSCVTGQECLDYCDNLKHFPDCVNLAMKYFPEAFAEEYTPNELADMEKSLQIIKTIDKFPGNSDTYTGYVAYCENPIHAEECRAFEDRYLGPEQGL